MEGISTPVQTTDGIAHRLHTIAQYSIVGIFGILPILFIPYAEFSLAFTKTAAVIVGILLALMLYSFAVLRTGSFRISLPIPAIALWLVVVAGLASALLSGDVRDAFFGDMLEQQTVVFLAVLALIVTIVPHILTDKRRIYTLYVTLAGSTVLLALFHLLRIVFGAEALSFGVFGGAQTLTPVGSWNDLAIFAGLAILISIVALEQLVLTQAGKWLFAAVSMVALLLITIINFSPVWFVLIVVSLIVLIYSLARDRMTPAWLQGTAVDRKLSPISLIIAGIVFVTSFCMIAGGSVISSRVSEITGISYVEVRPSLQATTEMVSHTYGQNALFGIGPNKFSDAWRLYRDRSLNDTIFWNTDFVAGVGYIPTFFVTMGIVGALAWIAFLITFVVMGVRMLMRSTSADRTWYFIGTSAFVTAVYLWGMSVVYVPGALLILLAALTTGLVSASHNALEPHRERTISMIGDRRSGFFLVTVAMLTVILSMSALYMVGRQYASAYMFTKSERAVFAGDTTSAREYIAEALLLSNDDRYYRRLAEIDYAELVATLNMPADTPDLQNRFQTALQGAVQNATRAVAIDGTDANNWSILGAIMSAIVPLQIEGAYERANEALTKARSLDPQNPIRTLMLARLSFAKGDVEDARSLMNEAIRQKPDYIDAAFLLSQLEIAAGNVEGAIQSTLRIIQLEPQNPARYFQLGVLELANNNVERGVIALEAAIQLDPQYANARYYLAFAYDSLGRTEDARTQLQRVLETNEGNQEVLALLARLDAGARLTEVPGTQAPVVSDTRTTTEDSTTEVTEDPDTPLLTPVNPIPTPSE